MYGVYVEEEMSKELKFKWSHVIVVVDGYEKRADWPV